MSASSQRGGLGVKRVEHGIAPLMESAVTIPININGKDSGIVVYVSTSPFGLVHPSDTIVNAVAVAVANAIDTAAIGDIE